MKHIKKAAAVGTAASALVYAIASKSGGVGDMFSMHDFNASLNEYNKNVSEIGGAGIPIVADSAGDSMALPEYPGGAKEFVKTVYNIFRHPFSDSEKSPENKTSDNATSEPVRNAASAAALNQSGTFEKKIELPEKSHQEKRQLNGMIAKQPSYEPKLREYIAQKKDSYIFARDPQSYITPGNEWVKYYASELYVDGEGVIRDKWVNDAFTGFYVSDNEQFGEDYWLNADYYLRHGQRGDCEDRAIAVASMLLSGEISVKNSDGSFKKQVIPAKVIIGYHAQKNGFWIRDTFVEYKLHNKTHITTTSGGIHYATKTGDSRVHDIVFSEFGDMLESGDIENPFKPLYEFDDKNLESYQKYWR